MTERAEANRSARTALGTGLRLRGFDVSHSQANFVYAGFGGQCDDVVAGLTSRGVIVRPSAPQGWLRISAGAPQENTRFFDALDEVLALTQRQ